MAPTKVGLASGVIGATVVQVGAAGIASAFSTCILVGRGERVGWKLPLLCLLQAPPGHQ